MDELARQSFGEWVRRRRRALDLTQAELGRRAGASAATIRKIEADERRPSRELAALLATVLAIPATERPAFLRAARGVAEVEGLPGMEESQPFPPAIPATPHNLPAPLTSFVNRAPDVAAVTTLLRRSDVRLLTLVGPPGIGKTRLSIHAAEALLPDFPDGVWFVDLAPITEPGLALSAIARLAGVRELADEPLAQQFRTVLGGKRVLLVLDNCEQVIGVAPEVSQVLQACKGLKVLATSRLPLQIYGEHEYAAPPLSLPPLGTAPEQMLAFEAVQLFIVRVRQHQPAFYLDATNAEEVLEILHKLQGIPLAIELAAATLRRMTVAELAVALRSNANWVGIIQATARDLSPRQRTLAGAIAWSYDLLDPDTRACLNRLAVCVGAFTLEAAAAVCAGLADADGRTWTQSCLATLADHNLLSSEPGRWRMLEMIREFAWNQLSVEERRLAQERHASYFQTLLARSSQDMAAIAADHHNYVAALQWRIEQGNATAALQMCADLAWFWETHGYVRTGQALIRRTLALQGEMDAGQRIDLLNRAANLSWQCHDFDHADEFAGQAIAVAQEQRPEALAALFNLLGRINIERGELEQAEAALLRSEELARQHPGLLSPGFPILQLGEVAWTRGDLAAAQALFDQAEAWLSTTIPDLARAILHTDQAELALARGETSAARQELLLAFPHARAHVRRLRYWLVALAGLLLAEGADPVQSVQCLAAEDRLGKDGAPLSPVFRALLARRLEATRTALGQSEWDTTWNAVHGWTAEQVLARAGAWMGAGA